MIASFKHHILSANVLYKKSTTKNKMIVFYTHSERLFVPILYTHYVSYGSKKPESLRSTYIR